MPPSLDESQLELIEAQTAAALRKAIEDAEADPAGPPIGVFYVPDVAACQALGVALGSASSDDLARWVTSRRPVRVARRVGARRR